MACAEIRSDREAEPAVAHEQDQRGNTIRRHLNVHYAKPVIAPVDHEGTCSEGSAEEHYHRGVPS